MMFVNLDQVNIKKIYIFEHDSDMFIGKFIYIKSDEIAIQDIFNNANRYFSPNCNLRIFEYKSVDLIGLPFAYNGPSATISGMGKIFNELNLQYSDLIKPILLKQSMNQSPIQYLNELLDTISERKCLHTIFIGGNHLSVLPLHKYANSNKICSIIFDAHRDYQFGLQSDFTHANFLNAMDDLSNTIIFGYRDGIDKSFKNCKIYKISQEESFIWQLHQLIIEGFHFYIDIDVDVFDPYFFPATCCPIKNGLSPQQMLKIIKIIGFKNIDYISIEEYISYLDDGHCIGILKNMIEEFIKGWNFYE